MLFVLLLLSSTTYDAIHETSLWIGLYWRNLLMLLQPLWNDDLGKAQQLLMGGYQVYRQAGLVVFPFVYFGVYWLILRTVRPPARTPHPTHSLTLTFCYSLLPIAIAYHFAHYFTFLLAEVRTFPWRFSDPFGFGWNLLSLPDGAPPPFLQTDAVWHTQVAALLLGHILSVYLAHDTARRVFNTSRRVIASQLPLLVLMVVYTIFGLWILSLPLGGQ